MWYKIHTAIRQVVKRISPLIGKTALDPVRRAYLRCIEGLAKKKGIAVVAAGVSLKVHPSLITVDWSTYEERPLREFSSRIEPGDIVYDIGAFIGIYTLVAAKKCRPQGKVVAFEPHPQAMRMLKESLVWNNVQDRVLAREIAVGSKAGKEIFYMADLSSQASSLFDVSAGSKSSLIPVTTLDLESDALKLRPTYLKIHAEGGELEVLKGAERVITEYSPKIFVSVHEQYADKTGASREVITAWLGNKGYTCEFAGEDDEIHLFCYRR